MPAHAIVSNAARGTEFVRAVTAAARAKGMTIHDIPKVLNDTASLVKNENIHPDAALHKVVSEFKKPVPQITTHKQTLNLHANADKFILELKKRRLL